MRDQINEWMYLSRMSNDKMISLYREGYLHRDDIELLHQMRIYNNTHLSEKQAGRLMDIETRVMQFDAAHRGELSDDDIAGMIAALGGDDAPTKPTFRAYSPPGGWNSPFKDDE